MNIKIPFDKLIHFFLALYIFIWYGALLPEMLEFNAVSYISAGISGALVVFFIGITFISKTKLSKVVQVGIIVLTLGFIGFNVLHTSVWGFMILSVLQGLSIGMVIKKAYLQKKLGEVIPYWSLGLFFSFATFFFPFQYAFKSKGASGNASDLYTISGSSSMVALDYGLLTFILVTFLVLVGLILKADNKSVQIEKIESKDGSKLFQNMGLLINGLLIMVEISFFFWVSVLKDKSQGWMYQLTIPLTLLLLFVLRKYFSNKFEKRFDIGWLFFATILVTLSLGLFYTFDFTLLFIVLFSFFMAFASRASVHIFNQNWDEKRLAILMFCAALLLVIGGLYIQNHIEYIISIKMPDNVIHLSARQAWIKELATFSALLVIITGILFLKRRKLKFKIMPFVVLTLIGLSSSCSYNVAKPTITEIINEYEVFTDTIGVLTKGVWPVSTDSIREAQKEKYIQLIAKLQTLDSTDLDLNDNINKDLLLLIMENHLNDLEFESHLMPLNSEGGFLTEIVYSIQYANTKNSEDKKAYIDKLNALPEFLAHFQNLMQNGIKKGKVAPKIVTQRCIELAAPFSSINIEDNIFLSPCGDSDSLKQVVKVIVEEKIAPAYQSFYSFLTKEYMAASKDAPGISQLPGGKKFYEMKTRYYTTLSMTPDEVFVQGEKEVKRIRSEMEAIIERIHFKGNFNEFVVFLRNDPQFYAKTPRELLYRASWLSKKMEGKLPLYFNRLPRMPFTIEEVSPSIAPNYTSGRYSEGSYTTGKPGAYWVNTYKLESRPLYALPALTLHEAVPGHHLQIMLSKEIKNIPKFRQDLYISAFGEGWGLYAEYLGKEAGMYETDFEDFGRLTYEMWRACRLVVDPGLHYKGWTQQQAIDFMASNTALSLHEVNTEVDRYIGWPGQAVSYKIGEIKIRQLRKIAEKSLGDKFDIKTFHDAILTNGSVGLNTLDMIVQKYIKDTKTDIHTNKKTNPEK